MNKYLTSEQQIELKKNLQNGYVRVAEHPTLPLKIYNYTPKAQYEAEWNPITRMCRGLVVDDSNRIVIECPQKFFNLGEPFAAKINLLDARISEKSDGYYLSCKIDDDYGLIITTRGSFDNKYVTAAKGFFSDSLVYQMCSGYTYFCELLQDFPGDESIILTRHPIPELVCWAIKDRDYQEIFPDDECPFSVAKTFSFSDAEQYLRGKVEGVVAQDPATLERVKIKTEWYIRNHRLISDCTKKRVWELMCEKQDIESLDIPDEFMPQMREWQTEIQSEFEEKWKTIQDIADKTEHLSDKELGLLRDYQEYKTYLFMLRKDRVQQCMDRIMESLKPTNSGIIGDTI